MRLDDIIVVKKIPVISATAYKTVKVMRWD